MSIRTKLLYALALAAFFGLVLFTRLVPLTVGDREIFVSVGERLVAGDVLYAGVFDNKDPLFYYLVALERAAGPLAEYLAELAFVLIAIASIFAIGLRLRPRRPARAGRRVLRRAAPRPREGLRAGDDHVAGHGDHARGRRVRGRRQAGAGRRGAGAALLHQARARPGRRRLCRGPCAGRRRKRDSDCVLRSPASRASRSLQPPYRRCSPVAGNSAPGSIPRPATSSIRRASSSVAALDQREAPQPSAHRLGLRAARPPGDHSRRGRRCAAARHRAGAGRRPSLSRRDPGRPARHPCRDDHDGDLAAPSAAHQCGQRPGARFGGRSPVVAAAGRWPSAAIVLVAAMLLSGTLNPRIYLAGPRGFLVRLHDLTLPAEQATALRAVTGGPAAYARLGQNDDGGHATGLSDFTLVCPSIQQYPFYSADELARARACADTAPYLIVTRRVEPDARNSGVVSALYGWDGPLAGLERPCRGRRGHAGQGLRLHPVRRRRSDLQAQAWPRDRGDQMLPTVFSRTRGCTSAWLMTVVWARKRSTIERT